MSDGVVESTHELTRPGQRAAYVASVLPMAFEDNEPADYSDPAYEQVRNAQSGIAFAFDSNVDRVRASDADPKWGELAPPFRQMRMSQAREAIAKETGKTLVRCEQIAANAEKEANELAVELSAPEKIDGAQSAVNVRAFQELSREAKVEQIHAIGKLLASDSGADPQTRRYARDYLASLLQVNPFANLLDSTSRAFATRIMLMTKDPAKYTRMNHLALAARSIRQSAARVRDLIAGEGDVRARLV